jgi:hypothetical protein
MIIAVMSLKHTYPTNERVTLSAKLAVEYPDNLW